MGIIRNMRRFVEPAVLPKISYKKKIIDTYTRFYKEENVLKKTILYESRDGKSLTDSPFAIFEYLLKEDKSRQYTHIWVVSDENVLPNLKKTYQKMPNVLFVVRNSNAYLKWLTKAEYLINNSTFQPFVTIKEEQTYINTWHGTPLKTMGFDIPGNPANAKNVVRNFYMADYLISPNPHTTRMFIDSYQLNDNFKGKIIEDGYPRIDQTFQTSKETMIADLVKAGLEIERDKKIILYTPTCKDSSLALTQDQVAQITKEMAVLRETFQQQYNVLIKVHPFLYKEAQQFSALKPFLIPDAMDTNKVLACVDCLITDYSSIFFDFLVTDRPILFYCWDDDLYGNERGKYIAYEDLPGPVTFCIEELITAVSELDTYHKTYKEKYQEFKERYTPYDDGQVTKRTVELIFKSQQLPNVNVIEAPKHKKRLLIYPGGMRSNGITSSFLNLLQNIDYNQYSIVCFLDNIRSDDQITNVSNIPKDVTLLFRFDDSNYTIKERYQDLSMQLNGIKKGKEDKYPSDIYEREIRRLLGGQTYDVAIDFSGYSLHWSKMVLATTANRYICFLHSDMLLDQNRLVNGRKIHYINLRGIFSVYHKYDKLVSVSEVINQINQEKLAPYAEKDKFVYATNTIDPKKILDQRQEKNQKPIVETTRLYRDGLIKEIAKKKQIRTSRPDTTWGNLQERQFTSERVLVLGSFVHEGDVFYKIAQEDCYIGWIKKADIDVLPVKIVAKKNVNYFGKLNTADSDWLYSGPIGLETSQPVATTEHLRNLYVSIQKEVVTQEATSVEVMLKGKKLGYLLKNQVTYSRQLNWTSQKPVPTKTKLARSSLTTFNRFGRKKQLAEIQQKPNKRERIEAYYQNKSEDSLVGYKSTKLKEASIQLGKADYIYVVACVTANQIDFYEIKNEQGNTYWLKKDETSLIPLDEETIILREPIDERVQIKKNILDVYATSEDCLKNKGTQVSAPKTVAVKEKLVTSLKREFLLTDWQGRKLWIKEEDTEKSNPTGVFNADGLFFPFPDKRKINIVTTGRLSHEKNQQVLIEAFSLFQKNNPESALFIIGTGPEKDALERKINELKLNDSVTLMGQVYNPFMFMKECQLFALTSLYEGQSLVLLEALTLGMTCLSTDIPACRNVLRDGAYGLLTKTNDAKGICDGLQELITTNKTFKKFDPIRYNQESLALFYQTLV